MPWGDSLDLACIPSIADYLDDRSRPTIKLPLSFGMEVGSWLGRLLLGRSGYQPVSYACVIARLGD